MTREAEIRSFRAFLAQMAQLKEMVLELAAQRGVLADVIAGDPEFSGAPELGVNPADAPRAVLPFMRRSSNPKTPGDAA